jgi:hypothetical protein
MGIRIGETIGAVLGFIPGVSTITGAFKAVVYYSRAKKNKDEPKPDKTKIAETATNTDITANETMQAMLQRSIDTEADQRKCYKRLGRAALIEMIPGVNIVAAIYSAVMLSKLSKARNANHNDTTKQKYLFDKYRVGRDIEGRRVLESSEKSKVLFAVLLGIESLMQPPTSLGKIIGSKSIGSNIADRCKEYSAGQKRKEIKPMAVLKQNIYDLNIKDFKKNICVTSTLEQWVQEEEEKDKLR